MVSTSHYTTHHRSPLNHRYFAPFAPTQHPPFLPPSITCITEFSCTRKGLNSRLCSRGDLCARPRLVLIPVHDLSRPKEMRPVIGGFKGYTGGVLGDLMSGFEAPSCQPGVDFNCSNKRTPLKAAGTTLTRLS